MSKRGVSSAEEQRVFERMREAERLELRRRYRETTPAERLQTALELSELGRDLRRGVRRAR